MAGFPPARGNGNPIAGLLGGLSAGLQGFMQARQFKDQEQMQQQELSNSRLQNSMSVFDMLSKIGQSDPGVLNSPQFQAFAKQNMGQGGIPMPTDAAGNIDANAFRTPLSALTLNSNDFERFNQYDPNSPQRQQILANYGGDDSSKSALLSGPRVPSPAERDANLSKYSYYIGLIGGGYDPRALVPQINAAAVASGQPQVTINAQGQVVPVGGTAALGETTTTKAKNAASAARTTYLDAATGKVKVDTDFAKMRLKYFPKMQNAQIAHLIAATGLDVAETQAVPEKVAIGWANANANVSRANDAHQRLQMDLTTFQQLGTKPQALAAYSGVINSMQAQQNYDRVAKDALRNQILTLIKNNGTLGVPDINSPQPKQRALAKTYLDLQRSYDHVNKRYNSDVIQLKQFQDNRANFTRKVHLSLGAPTSWHPTNNGQPTPHSPSGGARFSPDGKHYYDNGQYYDAKTNLPVPKP